MEKIVANIIAGMEALLSTAGGWIVTITMVVINYLGDLKLAFGAVFLAIIFDMVWGIIAAVKQRKFILSFMLRETFTKLAIYGTALFLILFIERSMHEEWFIATKTACAIAAACELWSIFANILIVRPNTPFVKLFRKHLVGEMSRKLNIKEDDIFNKNE